MHHGTVCRIDNEGARRVQPVGARSFSTERVVRWAAVPLTAALLAWIASVVEPLAIATSLREVQLHTVLAVVAALFVSYVLRALRLFEELHTQYPVRIRDCLRVGLLHNMSVNVMPFRSGEAAMPLLLARDLGIPVHRGIVTLVWLRVQDASVMAAIALLAWPAIAWPLRALGIVALALGFASLLRWARVSAPSLARLGRWRVALSNATSHAWRTWLWCVANWAVKLAAIAWLLRELTQLSPAAAVISALAGEGAAILPLQGIAGFGTYEAGVALGAAAEMQSPAASLASVLSAALVVHVLVIASATVAGLIALLLPRPSACAVAAQATP